MNGQAPGNLNPQHPQRRHLRGGGGQKHGLTVAEFENWQRRFLLAAENALRSWPKALKKEPIKKLKQKIGERVLDSDILREALKPYPLAGGRPTIEAWPIGRLGAAGLSTLAGRARGAAPQPPRASQPPREATLWIAHVHGLIQQYPTFG